MRSVFIALAVVSLSLASCGNSGKEKSVKKQYKYYCIMHPEVGANKPGICPKCGMQLVERDTVK